MALRFGTWLCVASLLFLRPAEAAPADMPSPDWWLKPHPDPLEYGLKACDSFQRFAIKRGDKDYAWLGPMAPEACRSLVSFRDPTMKQLLKQVWRDEMDRCLQENRGDTNGTEGVSGTAAGCRAKAEQMHAQQATDRLFGFFMIPAWTCAIDVNRRDQAYAAGICVATTAPEQNRKTWEELLAAAYRGTNPTLGGDLASCDDPSESRPLSPFASAALPLAPRGKPVGEIESQLAALGFSCGLAPGAGEASSRVPAGGRRCELTLFGHRWVERADKSGGIAAVSFSDSLQVTLLPDEDGLNRESCAKVESTGL